MNPATIVLNIVLATLVFAVPRKYFLLPFIIAVCMVPMNQRIIIVGLDFTVLRILVLCAMIRLYNRREVRQIKWNSFDKLILAWNIAGTVIYVIQWGDMRALINKCGVMYDCLGMYWLFRQTIRSWNDIFCFVRLFAIIAIISAPLIVAEKIRHASFYSIFGPVGSKFHRGRFRCAGPFGHYIMMGCFWANLLPLFYAMVKAKVSKWFYWVAFVSVLVCVFYSASSTPLMTTGAIVVFWMIYKYRSKGKAIFWSVCGVVFGLHLVMKAPVWHLMSRVNVFGGSTGWHRYNIFDEFVNHIPDWFFLGTRDTTVWSSYHGMHDITNQFMLEGIRGGFITMALFIVIIFQSVQIPCRYSLATDNEKVRWLCWAICVSMLGHIVSFWGVSYFGQIIVLLYLTFAVVGFIEEQRIGRLAMGK